MEDKKEGPDNKSGIFVVGFGGKHFEPYPAWRYHDLNEPIIVNNTDEDNQAQANGWKEINQPVTSVQYIPNWRYDLEDMNAKQLVLFIQEEFGVKLPVAAGCEKLIKAIWQLMRDSPKFSGRLCMLAQEIDMDYDTEIEWIKNAAENMEMEFSKEIII